jgi:H+/Cl- antiporter ClcA
MTWHRILLVPVVGGIVVGMFHSVLGVLDVILEFQKDYLGGQNRNHWLAGLKPVIKAIQAAVTLGTGCSLGPEGPSVDIGKAFGNAYSNLMNNTRERRIALVAAGAAAGIATGMIIL